MNKLNEKLCEQIGFHTDLQFDVVLYENLCYEYITRFDGELFIPNLDKISMINKVSINTEFGLIEIVKTAFLSINVENLIINLLLLTIFILASFLISLVVGSFFSAGLSKDENIVNENSNSFEFARNMAKLENIINKD